MSDTDEELQAIIRFGFELDRERLFREERAMNRALTMIELFDDAWAMIHMNDNTYSYPTAPASFRLLGLTEDNNTLRSFLRLLHLHWSIEVQIAPKPNVRLLDDGMLNATPQSEKDEQIFQRNSQYSPLLSLPGELRNRIFADVMGGFQVFVTSVPVPTGGYKDEETTRITNRIRSLDPSNRTAHHENILTFTDEWRVTTHYVPKVNVTRTTRFHGPGESNPFVSLQQICRQIYTETATLPFSGINRFWYFDDRVLTALMLRTKPGQIQAISKLFFNVTYGVRKPSETGDLDLERIRKLGMLPGLKHIHVAVAAKDEEAPSGYSYCIPQSMKDEALVRIQAGLDPRILELAPKDVELVFETHQPED